MIVRRCSTSAWVSLSDCLQAVRRVEQKQPIIFKHMLQREGQTAHILSYDSNFSIQDGPMLYSGTRGY